MPYSQFKTLESVVSTFDPNVEDRAHLYSQTAPIPPSDRLCEVINEGLDLVIATSTAKARSELLISPILMEARRSFNLWNCDNLPNLAISLTRSADSSD